MVIELANEVRKVLDEGIPKERKSVLEIEGIPKERKSVLEIEGIPKERKLVGPPHIPHKSHMPTLQLHPLPEAIAMDSS